MAELRGRIAQLLEERRLGQGGSDGATLRSFTISQTAALLALRKDAGREDWDWTLHLLRAANALSTSAAAGASWQRHDQDIVELELLHPGFELADFDLADPLVGALAADRGQALSPGSSAAADPSGVPRQAGLARWRVLIGRALNFALASEPVALELHTAAGSRRWERRPEVSEGSDPYAMRVLPAAERRSGFRVRLIRDGSGIGSRLKSLFGVDDPLQTLAKLWDARLLAPEGGDEVPDIVKSPRAISPIATGKVVELGEVARLGRGDALSSVWLVREGVKLLRLDGALLEAGFRLGHGGWIACPALRLSADERDVVRDASFEALLAWLFDMQAHLHETSPGAQEVIWPDRVEHLVAASGRPVSPEDLQAWIDSGRELLYISPHQVQLVPAAMRARVLAVWPSSLRLLQAQGSEGRWVPLRALGDRPSMNPIDLSALGQGSFDPVPLTRAGQLAWDPVGKALADQGAVVSAGEQLVFDVDAYVHRFAGATLGSILVLSYGRRVAHTRDHTRTLPGLTLVVTLRELSSGRWVSADELRERPELADQIFDRCAALVGSQGDQLLSTVLGLGGSWDTPFAQYQLGQLNGWSLGLRYRATEAGLELAWNAHPALGLEVAVDQGGELLTLGDLLERVRKVGFVPELSERGDYSRLESEDPDKSPVRLRRGARELVRRILGDEVILPMPFLVDAQPCVADAAQQAKLLAGAHLLNEDRSRAVADPRARLRVLGRLIVARALDKDAMGLEGARLWKRYDPRALSPTRRQSLRMILSERDAPGLAFPGAVSRDLGATVLELAPPLAHLLYRHEGFRPALRGSIALGVNQGGGRGAARSNDEQPRRRRGGPVMPLLQTRVQHEWAVGSLSVAADGVSGGIALWSKGLEVGTLRLAEPAGRVRGRLWLTARGRLARSSELQAAVTKLASELLADAPRQCSLILPSDPRRQALSHLMQYLRTRGMDFETKDSGVLAFEAGLDQSLRRMPVNQPLRGEALIDLVRNALGQNAPIDGAMLSWTLAELQDGRSKIELGNRNRWVKAARENTGAAFEAAALVLDVVFRDPQWAEALADRPPDEALRHLDWGLRSRWRLCARILSLAPES